MWWIHTLWNNETLENLLEDIITADQVFSKKFMTLLDQSKEQQRISLPNDKAVFVSQRKEQWKKIFFVEYFENLNRGAYTILCKIVESEDWTFILQNLNDDWFVQVLPYLQNTGYCDRPLVLSKSDFDFSNWRAYFESKNRSERYYKWLYKSAFKKEYNQDANEFLVDTEIDPFLNAQKQPISLDNFSHRLFYKDMLVNKGFHFYLNFTTIFQLLESSLNPSWPEIKDWIPILRNRITIPLLNNLISFLDTAYWIDPEFPSLHYLNWLKNIDSSKDILSYIRWFGENSKRELKENIDSLDWYYTKEWINLFSENDNIKLIELKLANEWANFSVEWKSFHELIVLTKKYSLFLNSTWNTWLTQKLKEWWMNFDEISNWNWLDTVLIDLNIPKRIIPKIQSIVKKNASKSLLQIDLATLRVSRKNWKMLDSDFNQYLQNLISIFDTSSSDIFQSFLFDQLMFSYIRWWNSILTWWWFDKKEMKSEKLIIPLMISLSRKISWFENKWLNFFNWVRDLFRSNEDHNDFLIELSTVNTNFFLNLCYYDNFNSLTESSFFEKLKKYSIQDISLAFDLIPSRLYNSNWYVTSFLHEHILETLETPHLLETIKYFKENQNSTHSVECNRTSYHLWWAWWRNMIWYRGIAWYVDQKWSIKTSYEYYKKNLAKVDALHWPASLSSMNHANTHCIRILPSHDAYEDKNSAFDRKMWWGSSTFHSYEELSSWKWHTRETAIAFLDDAVEQLKQAKAVNDDTSFEYIKFEINWHWWRSWWTNILKWITKKDVDKLLSRKKYRKYKKYIHVHLNSCFSWKKDNVSTKNIIENVFANSVGTVWYSSYEWYEAHIMKNLKNKKNVNEFSVKIWSIVEYWLPCKYSLELENGEVFYVTR